MPAIRRTLILLAAVALSAGIARAAPGPETRPAATAGSSTPQRGIAVVASSIGREISAEEVVAVARACHLNVVAIDFAWITYHWPRTDLKKVQGLCRELRKAHVEVVAIYRPRVLLPEEAAIHYAQDGEGRVAEDHLELCFAAEDSVLWAAGWGERILSSLESVDRICLYNLRAACFCPRCRDYQGRTHIAKFFERCRGRWSRLCPSIQIGHVGIGDEYADKLDFCWPFLPVNRFDDGAGWTSGDLAAIKRYQADHPKKRITPFLKTFWEDQTNNDSADVSRAMQECEKDQLGYILWYYEWLFHAPEAHYDRKAIIGAMGGDWAKLSKYLAK